MQTAVDAGPTRNVQLILEIVDGIYAAGCGEATWDQVLARICQLGRLDGAALSTVGADEPQRILLASFRLGSRIDQGALQGDPANGSQAVDSILRSPPGAVLWDRPITSERAAAPSRWTGAVPVKLSIAWACVIVG